MPTFRNPLILSRGEKQKMWHVGVEALELFKGTFGGAEESNE